jgi:predicted transcriptional regulator
MRTTIDIDDDKLLQLRQLAATRGEKGYSRLVDEALEAFLKRQRIEERQARLQRQSDAILAAAGTISEETADQMMESVRESRRNWRTPSSIPTS